MADKQDEESKDQVTYHWVDECIFDVKIKIEDRQDTEIAHGVLLNWKEEEIAKVSVIRVASDCLPYAKFLQGAKSESLLKVYSTGPWREGRGFFVVTERIIDMFQNWKKLNNPRRRAEFCNGNEFNDFSYDCFLHPLKSLIKNLISMLSHLGDFKFTEKDVYVVERYSETEKINVLELRVGVSPLKFLKDEHRNLECLISLGQLLEEWMEVHGINLRYFRGLNLLIYTLQNIRYVDFAPKAFYLLGVLLKHPIFLSDYHKGVIFEMVVKMDWLERMNNVQHNGDEIFLQDIINGLQYMDIKKRCLPRSHLGWDPHHLGWDPHQYHTIWYHPEHCKSDTLDNWFTWFKANRMGDDAKEIRLTYVLRTLRNIWAHLNLNITRWEDVRDIVDAVNTICPGIWDAIHYALMQSEFLENFYMDEELLLS